MVERESQQKLCRGGLIAEKKTSAHSIVCYDSRRTQLTFRMRLLLPPAKMRHVLTVRV